MKHLLGPTLLALLYSAGTAPSAVQEEPGTEFAFFEKRIRPILEVRCFSCHSAQAGKTKGNLALDSAERLLKGGDSGPALVPGHPENSLLVKAVTRIDPDLSMPPRVADRLTESQVRDVEQWIRRGAAIPRPVTTVPSAEKVWEARKKWLFAPPQDPPLPVVRLNSRVRNGVDAFILGKLEASGLAYAPEADKRILLRRATLDLIGLPPTPQEVDAFLADQDPRAFERVVDRLLSSPRYGERWGRHWLDLVRYCDEIDEIWRYRDWVIDSFNRDLPYDDFIKHQLMGDLLPPPEPGGINAAGIVATGVLTLGPWGGIDKKKMLTDIVDDQIDLVGRTLLGMTLACARCHDHKYDPITTKDYYALAGIFLSSHILSGKEYAAHVSHRKKIALLSPAQLRERERMLRPLREAEDRLAQAEARERSALATSLLSQVERYVKNSDEIRRLPAGKPSPSLGDIAKREGLRTDVLKKWIDYLSQSPDRPYPRLDSAVAEFDTTPRTKAWKVALARSPWFAVNQSTQELHIDSFIAPPRSSFASPGTGIAWRSPVRATIRVKGRLEDADAGGVGIDFIVDLITPRGARELVRDRIPNNGERQLGLEGIRVNPGDSLILQLYSAEPHYDTTIVDLRIETTDGSARWTLAADVVDTLLDGNPHADSLGNRGVWSFLDLTGSRRPSRLPALDDALGSWTRARSSGEPEAADCELAAALADSESDLVRELTGPRSPLWIVEKETLPGEAQALLSKLAREVEALRKSAPPPIPEACGIQEGGVRYSLYPGIQDVAVHLKGRTDRFGEIVPRRMPEMLAGSHAPAIREGSGRRELAQWIASPSNPLTARVLVNRLWQYHFGEGIVRTPSNFGKMGEPPSHPELLDWLACRFLEGGWSMKSVHRLIMLSAVYQQSSRATPETLRADPENRLLGRFFRRRLEAEEVRDSLLAISGGLDSRPGGRADQDASSRRRMLYLASTRKSRPNFEVAFDAANPSAIVAKRASSTVAPQALFLMNDGWVLDRVRDLARRAAGASDEERIHAAHRLVYGRRATPEELALARAFLRVTSGSETSGPRLDVWELYVQALVLSNEFMFVE